MSYNVILHTACHLHVILDLSEVGRFLEKVKEACSSASFQQQLAENMAARARQRDGVARIAIGAIFISSCRHLLRRFGFKDHRQGYDEMFAVVFSYGQASRALLH